MSTTGTWICKETLESSNQEVDASRIKQSKCSVCSLNWKVQKEAHFKSGSVNWTPYLVLSPVLRAAPTFLTSSQGLLWRWLLLDSRLLSTCSRKKMGSSGWYREKRHSVNKLDDLSLIPGTKSTKFLSYLLMWTWAGTHKHTHRRRGGGALQDEFPSASNNYYGLSMACQFN